MPRSLRRLLARLGRPICELVFHERYQASLPEVPLDPLRAERIMAFLASEGLVGRRSLHRPEMVSLKSLERVHRCDYLDSLQDPRTLTSILGTEVTHEQAERLLDLQRLQAGGTLLAARLARSQGVAVHLGGGLHHAGAGEGGGFCIFNDVAVAISDQRRRGFAGRILVVDLDVHDGDGTRSLFAEDPDVFTLSIHGRHWDSVEARSSLAVELGSGVEDAAYLEAIERHVAPVFESFRPRLVFYLAGCDPARDDSLGDWRITPRGMLERDLRIYELARRVRRLPLVILLAGGYGTEAWRYSARFLSALGGRRPLEPPSTDDITLSRYRRISRRLSARELSDAGSKDDFGITEADIYLPGWGMARESRFLGYYTRTGLELVFERGGFLDRLRDLGFGHPALELQLDDPAGHGLRIFGDSSRRELLVEVRAHRDRRTLPGYELLAIDWLLLQNPRAKFHPSRPPLPDQTYPGLGMLRDAVSLFCLACERLHLDGLTFVPSQLHTAAAGKGRPIFLDPHRQAQFEALLRLLDEVSLSQATQALQAGRVVDAASGEVLEWRPETMILPVSERLERHAEDLVRAARQLPRPRYLIAPEPGQPA